MEKVEFLAPCERDEFTAEVSPSDACDGHERKPRGLHTQTCPETPVSMIGINFDEVAEGFAASGTRPAIIDGILMIGFGTQKFAGPENRGCFQHAAPSTRNPK